MMTERSTGRPSGNAVVELKTADELRVRGGAAGKGIRPHLSTPAACLQRGLALNGSDFMGRRFEARLDRGKGGGGGGERSPDYRQQGPPRGNGGGGGGQDFRRGGGGGGGGDGPDRSGAGGGYGRGG